MRGITAAVYVCCMEITQTQITAGSVLTGRFIGDADLTFSFTVIARKGSFCTVNINGKIERRKIHTGVMDGLEYIFPYGKYSMAPVATFKP